MVKAAATSLARLQLRHSLQLDCNWAPATFIRWLQVASRRCCSRALLQTGTLNKQRRWPVLMVVQIGTAQYLSLFLAIRSLARPLSDVAPNRGVGDIIQSKQSRGRPLTSRATRAKHTHTNAQAHAELSRQLFASMSWTNVKRSNQGPDQDLAPVRAQRRAQISSFHSRLPPTCVLAPALAA